MRILEISNSPWTFEISTCSTSDEEVQGMWVCVAKQVLPYDSDSV